MPKECVDLVNWMELFDIVGLSWAVAGCFEVQYQPIATVAAEEILFVHQQDITDYKWEFQQRAPN